MHCNFRTCQNTTTSIFFFSFKCKPINFYQSSLAEIQTFGKVPFIFTHKEDESKLLKRILRLDMLVQNLLKCKLIQPHSAQELYKLVCANIWPFILIRERFKVFKDSSATFYTVTFYFSKFVESLHPSNPNNC